MSTPDPTPTDTTAAQKYAAVRHYVDWALADAELNIQDNPLHPAYFRGKKSALGAIKAFMDGLEGDARPPSTPRRCALEAGPEGPCEP